MAPSAVRWVQKNDKALARQCGVAMKPRLRAAGEAARAASVRVLSQPGPSRPGQPPGKRTGRLSGALKVRAIGGANPGFRVAPKDKESKKILGRLTYGFTGRDSRGRVYHEPPRPWSEQALRQAKGEVLMKLTVGPPITGAR